MQHSKKKTELIDKKQVATTPKTQPVAHPQPTQPQVQTPTQQQPKVQTPTPPIQQPIQSTRAPQTIQKNVEPQQVVRRNIMNDLQSEKKIVTHTTTENRNQPTNIKYEKTRQEKFEEMVRLNKHLAKLKDEFDLTFDI